MFTGTENRRCTWIIILVESAPD